MLLMEAHSNAPLFAERRRAELVALDVSPAGAATTRSATCGDNRLQLYVTIANERARYCYGPVPIQEIWRAGLTPAPGITPPLDPRARPTATRATRSSSVIITWRWGRATTRRSGVLPHGCYNHEDYSTVTGPWSSQWSPWRWCNRPFTR
ncbi:MAG: hypothetical protein SNJ69_13145 [Chloroflexaceae bacterium]